MNEPPVSSPIAALPVECWQQILNLLSLDELFSVSLTSQSLRVVVEPILYRDVSWNWNPVPVRRILLLLRTVLQRPQVGTYIQHLSLLSNDKNFLNDAWREPGCDIDDGRDIFLEVLHDAQRIVSQVGIPDAEKWNSTLQTCDPYAFTTILLSQLHGLRSLKLDYSFVWKSGFPGLMLRHALLYKGTLLSKFRLLREVEYGANVRMARIWERRYQAVREEGYPFCDPAQFPAWFYLPALQSLAVWLMTKGDLFVMSGEANISRLHTLILTRSTIREEQIPAILSAAARLKTLHLGMAYRRPGKDGGLGETAFRNGDAILQGLKSVKGTLSNFSLGWEYYPPLEDLKIEPGERELTTRFHGFFNDFTNLEAVEIPVTSLLGWNPATAAELATSLPTTLRRLCLRGDPVTALQNRWGAFQIDSRVTDSVVDLRACMPALEEVVSRHWTVYIPSDLERSRRIHDEMRGIGAQHGIHRGFVLDHLSTGIWTHPSHRDPERVTDA